MTGTGAGDAHGLDPIRHPIDPSAAVRGGFDATALLVLWLLGCAVPALILGGLSYAWLVSERLESIPDVITPVQALRLLVSPFVLIAVAIILQFLVGVAALVLAYPLSRRETGSSIGPGMLQRPFRGVGRPVASGPRLPVAAVDLDGSETRRDQARPVGTGLVLVGPSAPGRGRHPDRHPLRRDPSQSAGLTAPGVFTDHRLARGSGRPLAASSRRPARRRVLDHQRAVVRAPHSRSSAMPVVSGSGPSSPDSPDVVM